MNSYESPWQHPEHSPVESIAETPTTFAADTPEPTTLVPTATSALEHRYDLPDQAASPVEKLTETAVGPITVVQEGSGVPYDVDDLIQLLSTHQEADIVYPPNPTFAIPPDRKDIIIRRNSDTRLLLDPHPRAQPTTYDGPPPTPDAITAHLQCYERLLAGLAKQGLPLLAHDTYIVEQDPHNAYQPTVYTITQRLHGDEHLTRHHPQYRSLSAQRCPILASHIADTPLGEPIITELADSAQHSPTGHLLDYDGYVTADLDERLIELRSLAWWVRDALPPSAQKSDIIDRIYACMDDVYQSP